MNILSISPHADDSEFGAGATLRKLVENDNVVCIMIFNDDPELVKEGIRAAKVIGATTKIIPMQGRIYGSTRQKILDHLIIYRTFYSPDIVFVPSRTDIHQDHQVITNEAIRAFRESTILGYNEPWNQNNVITNYFVEINEGDFYKKMDALEEYKSRKHKPYFSWEYQKSIVRCNGIKIKVEYAEAFEAIQIIGNKTI